MQSMTLHATPDTTRKITKHVLVVMAHSPTNRHHVTGAAIVRIHRSEDVIEQRSLFKLRILDVGMNGKQTARHLQHVVDVAGLICSPVYALGELIGWSEVFVFAVPARGVCMIVDYCVPKELGRRAFRLLAGVNVLHQHSEHLRNLRVAMLSGEFIFAALEGIEKGVVIEAMREIQPALITSVGIELCQHLVHAPEFRVEHLLSLFGSELQKDRLGPGGKPRLELERGAVAGVLISVSQTGESFVQRVPGRPETV